MNATIIGDEIESKNESGEQFRECARLFPGHKRLHQAPLQVREIYDLLSKEPELPMTQIIGIICKKYILVASESQYTPHSAGPEG
jgi:hypothetical protein